MVSAQPSYLQEWPDDELEILGRCPVCGGEARELLHGVLRDRIFFASPGSWQLWRCASCGCGYLDPRPTPATIGRAYEGYFTHEAPPDVGQMGLAQRIRRTLANGYRNRAYGTREAPASWLGVPVAALLPSMRATLDSTMRHLPRPEPGQRLLDVGCGNGAFLRRAATAGWQVCGVDFDEGAVLAARASGLDVRVGDISVFDGQSVLYDVITVSHVVEHVHDPHALLRACARLLRPGGCLWIETPNIDALGHAIYGEHWRGLEPPRHLVLFTLAGLTAALRESGFERVETPPPRPRCRFLFAASEAIAAGRDPNTEASLSRRAAARAHQAERQANRDARVRELITLMAWTAE